MSARRELHRPVRLRVVWDFLLEFCAREQALLLDEEDGTATLP